jgi:membrane associated rhomboid family serine protease
MKSQKKRFYYSALPFVLMVGLMVIFYVLNNNYELNYISWGVFPRSFSGLKGIIFAPVIHGSVEHLFNNSFPILILGTALLYYYGRLGVKVFVVMYLLTGMLVWISARESFHIGASGIVYALAAFLFLSGLIRKEKKLMALSLLVTFMYGSLFWGIFPVKDHISWESHFWGGIVGFVIAWYYRKQGPQRVKFNWEEEDEDENPQFEWEHLKQKELIDRKPDNNAPENPKPEVQNEHSKPVNRIVIKYDYKGNKPE